MSFENQDSNCVYLCFKATAVQPSCTSVAGVQPGNLVRRAVLDQHIGGLVCLLACSYYYNQDNKP